MEEVSYGSKEQSVYDESDKELAERIVMENNTINNESNTHNAVNVTRKKDQEVIINPLDSKPNSKH